MLTVETIEAADRLAGNAKVQAFAAIARQLSEDLLHDIREGVPAFDRHHGRAYWEHPGGLTVALTVQRDEAGAPLGFVAELRCAIDPFPICRMGFAYLDPADTQLVMRKVFGLDE